MTRIIRICITLCILFGFAASGLLNGQELNIKIGFRHTIKSEILNENREILIHLPENYDESNKSYPVLYRLDGDINQMLETVSIVNRLTYSDEITPEMIIVSIVNINRDSDMWPVNTKYYPEPNTPGAEDFLNFIQKELIPYVENEYNTTQEKIICGQSLSSLFVLYALLEKPELFDSFIASSAGFPDCEDYFKKLADTSLQQIDRFDGRKIFISNGMKDPLDPNGSMHLQILDFSNELVRILGNSVSLKYLTYESEGHVPFHSLYDGLKFIYDTIKEIE